ncbi:MAG: type II toxin-antitoxin system HicA family toxin [Fastidiosipilaceae bacterium]
MKFFIYRKTKLRRIVDISAVRLFLWEKRKDGIMTQKEKQLKRLFSKPNDYHFKEATTILERFGYVLVRSTGSHMFYYSEKMNRTFSFVKPHPNKELKPYAVKQLISEISFVLQYLKEEETVSP